MSDPVLTELILEEKRLKAQIAIIDQKLVEPEARLAKARSILLRAKEAYEAALEPVSALKSDRTLIEGDLEIIADKKAQARMQARLAQAGGVRPGTQDFVDQMNEIAGDPEVARLKAATEELDLDAALAELKDS